MPYLELYEELFELSGIVAGSLIFSLFTGIALFVLQGFGLMQMSKSLGLKAPWIGFIPFASIFSFGRVAQTYIKKDGKKSAKFSITLLILYILYILFVVALTVSLVIAAISVISNSETALANDTEMELSMFGAVIAVVAIYFIVLALAISYKIVYFIALWRIFALFDHINATLYTVLSIVFSFMGPIFLFILRKRRPKISYNSRMGYEQL